MRRLVSVLALAVPVLAGAPALAAGWSLEMRTEPLPLDFEDRERKTVGHLRYRGGLVLEADNGAFGGLSALDVSPDGKTVLAITDTGRWFQTELIYVNGRLALLTRARMGIMYGLDGEKLSGHAADSESMTRLPGGDILVSFERDHRLWRYPGDSVDFRRPEAVTPPPDLELVPGNGGMEAITALADGRLLVLTEGHDLQPGLIGGWIGDGRTWERLGYAASGGFRPTGAATLPNGDVLVLERRFDVVTGPAARLQRIPAAEIRPGARLSPSPIATLAPPLVLDNFEGVAVRPGPRGETFIYLVSDNNFLDGFQRTMLVVFELPAE